MIQINQPLFIHTCSSAIIIVPGISYFWKMLKSLVILLIIITAICSCERMPSPDRMKLVFSEDTINFDTVFTSIGSATRELRIKNAERSKINIDHIYISGGQTSQFRLNIDGESVSEKRNMELDRGDSLFIFIDVLVDPTNRNSPIAITDSIMFIMGDETQKVQLLAWGQNINLINKKLILSETWDSLKPYVIFSNVMVDTSETLTVEEGARIYFHRNSSMTIAGNLVVNGSVRSPVLFAGDRLEKMYEDIPGQWSGLFFLNTSKGNNIDHAIIRNTIYGLRLGETGTGAEMPDMKLFSSSISHSTISGLSAINGIIEAADCIFYHCGSYCISLSAGGNYTFTQCSVFNQWEYGFRLTASLYISEKPVTSGGTTSQMDLNFNNSVVFGNILSEVDIIPLATSPSGNYYFDHCLLKLDTINASFWDRDEFPGTLINKNPLFIDESVWDLRPDTLSPLIENGNPVYITGYPVDFRGVLRPVDGNPDIGAYERIPGEHKKEK